MKKINHPGIIKSIENNVITVEIRTRSACASCESKSMCQMSESKEKQIAVPTSNPEIYAIGQSVDIVMQEQLGLQAVFLAYIIPFIVCITALFGLSFITDNELIYGVLALSATGLYFLGLKLVSKQLSRTFLWYIA